MSNLELIILSISTIVVSACLSFIFFSFIWYIRGKHEINLQNKENVIKEIDADVETYEQQMKEDAIFTAVLTSDVASYKDAKMMAYMLFATDWAFSGLTSAGMIRTEKRLKKHYSCKPGLWALN